MFDYVQQTWFVIRFFTFPWFLFNLLCKWFHGFLRAVCQRDVKEDYVVLSLRFLSVFRLRAKGRSIFSHFRTFFLSSIFRNQILSVKKFIHYDILTWAWIKQWVWRDARFSVSRLDSTSVATRCLKSSIYIHFQSWMTANSLSCQKSMKFYPQTLNFYYAVTAFALCRCSVDEVSEWKGKKTQKKKFNFELNASKKNEILFDWWSDGENSHVFKSASE